MLLKNVHFLLNEISILITTFKNTLGCAFTHGCYFIGSENAKILVKLLRDIYLKRK